MNSVSTSIPVLVNAMKTAKQSFDAKIYYSAAIKLAEAYARMNEKDLLEKAVFMLENIFPKVLMMQSKTMESDLYLTYAIVSDISSPNGKIKYLLQRNCPNHVYQNQAPLSLITWQKQKKASDL
jgi:hypothetical protein